MHTAYNTPTPKPNNNFVEYAIKKIRSMVKEKAYAVEFVRFSMNSRCHPNRSADSWSARQRELVSIRKNGGMTFLRISVLGETVLIK